MEIEHFKTVNVALNFNGVDNLTSAINIEFSPDEVVLKYISIYSNSTNNDKILHLHSDLINNQTLATFADNANRADHVTDISIYNETINTPFRLNKSVNGFFKFYLSGMENNQCLSKTDLQIKFSITLLFLKYKSSK